MNPVDYLLSGVAVLVWAIAVVLAIGVALGVLILVLAAVELVKARRIAARQARDASHRRELAKRGGVPPREPVSIRGGRS